MKFIVLIFSLFVFSSCSSIFYQQNQAINLIDKDDNSAVFSLFDEFGNKYSKTLEIRYSKTQGSIDLILPKFSDVKYKNRSIPRINYLMSEDNGQFKVYEVRYRMRYDGSKFEPYATFGMASTSFAALTVAMIPISIASNDIGVTIVNLLFAAASAAGVVYVDLPTGLLSQIYSWSLSRKGIYRKWKHVGTRELDELEYPDFLSSYRLGHFEDLNATLVKNKSSKMKRLVSTYNSVEKNLKSPRASIQDSIMLASDIFLKVESTDSIPILKIDSSEQKGEEVLINLEDSNPIEIIAPKKMREEGVINGYWEMNYADKVILGSPGYYLVSGIYKSSGLANRMKDAMSKKGIQTNLFRDKKNNMFYLYILKFDDSQEAENAKSSGLNKQYKGKLWIKKIE